MKLNPKSLVPVYSRKEVQHLISSVQKFLNIEVSSLTKQDDFEIIAGTLSGYIPSDDDIDSINGGLKAIIFTDYMTTQIRSIQGSKTLRMLANLCKYSDDLTVLETEVLYYENRLSNSLNKRFHNTKLAKKAAAMLYVCFLYDARNAIRDARSH